MTNALNLYATPPHTCSYFDDRSAVTLFADPNAQFDGLVYQWLIDRGFRRSGAHIYKPKCPDCNDCIPVRIAVNDWRPRRNQRRTWNRVAERLQIKPQKALFQQNHFDLYTRYLNNRHPDGDMAHSDEDAYMNFLATEWCDSRFVEISLDGALLAIAVTDYLPLGLSAVYTFFDPAQEGLSPGVIAILWQIQEARRLGRPYLYLGYWIAECRKMAYKDQYRPFEAFIDGQWQQINQGS